MLKSYITAVKNIFFPALCFCCEDKLIASKYLCKKCKDQIKFLTAPCCQLCSSPVVSHKINLCKTCSAKHFFYDKVICASHYTSPIQQLVHLFKYKDCDYLSALFASLLTSHLQNIGFTAQGYDFITSVPMHPAKLKMRGYNQAELLGAALAKDFNKPFKNDIIYQTKLRPSQTKLKKKERAENTKDMFTVKEDLSSKRIIVIDDIFTTGATAQSCAYALKEKGAGSITFITLAKAQ